MNSIIMTGPALRRRAIRKFTNVVALTLSGLATAIGLFFLGAILYTLLRTPPIQLDINDPCRDNALACKIV